MGRPHHLKICTDDAPHPPSRTQHLENSSTFPRSRCAASQTPYSAVTAPQRLSRSRSSVRVTSHQSTGRPQLPPRAPLPILAHYPHPHGFLHRHHCQLPNRAPPPQLHTKSSTNSTAAGPFRSADPPHRRRPPPCSAATDTTATTATTGRKTPRRAQNPKVSTPIEL